MPGFKGGQGAAVKELTLQRGLFIGTNRCPPPAWRPTDSNSFCSSPWTAGNWRAHGRAAAPIQRFYFLEWQLDELRREELALWRSNYAASQEKYSSGLCHACLHNAKEMSRRSLGRLPQQGRCISKSYLFTGDPEKVFVGSCRKVEAPEIQDAITSSRSRQQQIYLSGLLGACHCFKCHNYRLVSSHPWLPSGSLLCDNPDGDYLCHMNNICRHNHLYPLCNSPISFANAKGTGRKMISTGQAKGFVWDVVLLLLFAKEE